jgi:hypothetical protein
MDTVAAEPDGRVGVGACHATGEAAAAMTIAKAQGSRTLGLYGGGRPGASAACVFLSGRR